MEHLRALRDAKSTQEQLEQKEADTAALESAWNRRHLRHGDKVGCPIGAEEQVRHPNQWGAEYVVALRLQSVGRSLELTGINGAHRGLSIACVLAEAMRLSQDTWLSEKIAYIKSVYVLFRLS